MSTMLAEIRRKIADDQFEFSKHAVDQSSCVGFTYKKLRRWLLVVKLLKTIQMINMALAAWLVAWRKQTDLFTFSVAIPLAR